MLPTLSPDLTRVERLKPITGKLSGELVAVDRGWLAEVLDRLVEAIGAVERGNVRAGGVKQERRCVAVVLATGAVPLGCTGG
ncbi:hypothetical protein [Sphingomonas sp. Leaf37]|uniref:hypothetical protein n=1 Tax=Sphingomonas sp. Leaf37 TaxID=2876552 RepID=UPI001E466E15|nr:hypothetical protein [Sphingomonas sp. Leaf37]